MAATMAATATTPSTRCAQRSAGTATARGSDDSQRSGPARHTCGQIALATIPWRYVPPRAATPPQALQKQALKQSGRFCRRLADRLRLHGLWAAVGARSATPLVPLVVSWTLASVPRPHVCGSLGPPSGLDAEALNGHGSSRASTAGGAGAAASHGHPPSRFVCAPARHGDWCESAEQALCNVHLAGKALSSVRLRRGHQLAVTAVAVRVLRPFLTRMSLTQRRLSARHVRRRCVVGVVCHRWVPTIATVSRPAGSHCCCGDASDSF